MSISFQPIGVIRSPFDSIENVPIQPTAAIGIGGAVEIFTEFVPGLKDLEGFSHIILLYHFHRATQSRLIVTPFLDREARGVFSTRAPSRPNPLGLSIVKLLNVEGNILHIENVDIVNETPLLDIKPYVPEFDQQEMVRTGWLATAKGQIKGKRSDDRFG